MACATFYVAPESFAAFLCGQWKRNLQWHGLGGMFPHQRSSSSAVIIAAAELGALAEPGSTFLTWVFGEGRGEGEISMQCIPVPADDGVQEQQGAAATRCLLNWTRKGVAGHGVYKADLGIATLHFEGPGSQATVTYRILDGDSALRAPSEPRAHLLPLQHSHDFCSPHASLVFCALLPRARTQPWECAWCRRTDWATPPCRWATCAGCNRQGLAAVAIIRRTDSIGSRAYHRLACRGRSAAAWLRDASGRDGWRGPHTLTQE